MVEDNRAVDSDKKQDIAGLDEPCRHIYDNRRTPESGNGGLGASDGISIKSKGDGLTEFDRATREKSRESVRSFVSASRIYDDTDRITVDAEDNVPRDGKEFTSLDPDLVTWTDEYDPENPRNWSKKKKMVTSSLVSLFTFCVALAPSVIAPAVTAIMQDYHNHNQVVGKLMFSILLLGWAFFSLIVAPLSEVFGRKIIMIIAMTGGTVFQVGCALAPNTASMIIFRFLAGGFGCAPLAVGAGSMADLYIDEERSWPLALYSLGPNLGPVVAAISSGFAVQYLDWHWAFWIIVIFTGTITIIGFIFMDESYAPVLLARRAKRLRNKTGNPDWHTVWEVNQESMVVKLRNAIIRPIYILCTNFVVFGLALHMSFVNGFLYLLLVDFPILWHIDYGYTLGVTGLMYISLGIGFLFGIFVCTPLIRNHCISRAKQGRAKPEDKLYYLPASTLMMSVGLFWYGWSAQAKIMWLMPNIGVGLFGAGFFVVFQAIQSYLVELNTRFASSILASAVLFRAILGCVFPLFGHAMYVKLGYGWASTLVGLLVLMLGMPFPILIYIKGPKIRAWCDEHITIK